MIQIGKMNWNINKNSYINYKKKQVMKIQVILNFQHLDDLRAQLNLMKRKLNDYDKQFDGKNPEEL